MAGHAGEVDVVHAARPQRLVLEMPYHVRDNLVLLIVGPVKCVMGESNNLSKLGLIARASGIKLDNVFVSVDH